MSFGQLDQAFIMNVAGLHPSRLRLDPYATVRGRAMMARLLRTIQRKPHSLLSLPATTNLERATYLGHRQARITDIAGSVNRSRDFDADFMPLEPVDQARWLRVYATVEKGLALPPVKLIKVDDYYFVLDGNHRVSVARFCGIEYIDAEVVEYVFAPGGQLTRGVSEQLMPGSMRKSDTPLSSEDYKPHKGPHKGPHERLPSAA